jgi:glutamate-1-semialdehyde aminotransferase
VGKVQHSGTFNAHLVPVLAGIAFLREVAKPGFYPKLRELERVFHTGMDSIIGRHDLEVVVPRHGARFDILLGRRTPALRYEDTFCHDREAMLAVERECWKRGVYFHDYGGSPVHHGYSVQHTTRDMENVLDVMEQALVACADKLKRKER